MLTLYPRLIAVHRAITVAGNSDAGGLVGYSGMTANPDAVDSGRQGETVLFTNIPASIQATAAGRKKASTLPSDSVFAPTWVIYTALSALAKGSVRDRDIIIDDEGYRYEVGQAYWNILGHKISCIRLEA
jgi:hypothetical protein